MTSRHLNQSLRRHPLKRVRLDNENQGFTPYSNGQANKKFCHESLEDSAFIEIEKSSDERAYDLFHKEYFSQFRPYFKHYSIVTKFIEHLWSNMIESSKVAFVKKILKEQGIYDVSTKNLNDADTFSNDENDSQINRSLNEPNRTVAALKILNKYSRGFIDDLSAYCKHWITPRFIDKNSLSKKATPLRRSSRIRRAPVKCVCATCITTRANEDDDSASTSTTEHDPQVKIFRQLIDYYQQLDDQNGTVSDSSSAVKNENKMQVNEINDNQIQMPLSQVIETPTHVISSPPMMPIVSMGSNDVALPSLNLSVDSTIVTNEKSPLVTVDSPPIAADAPIRRTYIIMTELDEPFFGPYPIEFTITI